MFRNVGIAIIHHPIFDGLYHPSIVMTGGWFIDAIPTLAPFPIVVGHSGGRHSGPLPLRSQPWFKRPTGQFFGKRLGLWVIP